MQINLLVELVSLHKDILENEKTDNATCKVNQVKVSIYFMSMQMLNLFEEVILNQISLTTVCTMECKISIWYANNFSSY